MKVRILAAASDFALSVFLISSPAGAQVSYPAPSGDRADANGMATTHSTPEERAETAAMDSLAAAGAQAQDQASADDAQDQAQQQQYQQQLQRYQEQMRRREAQQQRYEDRTAMYENLRARYAAERAAHHRDLWPERHWIVVERDYKLIGQRVELVRDNRVGMVADTAHAANGDIEALLVRLDDGKLVWIDSRDIRFNRVDGVVMTDPRFDDLRDMAHDHV